MEITASMVKELRTTTGAGVMECKRALEESLGDPAKAAQLLHQKAVSKAAKKAERTTTQGLIEAYVHAGCKVASLVELRCETDFVARTDEFRSLAHDLAMQVAASDPLYVAPADVPEEVLEEKREQFRREAEGTGKPEAILDKIVEGKMESYCAEACLLRQPFIKETDKTVQDVINEQIAKLGENIQVARIARFELGTEG